MTRASPWPKFLPPLGAVCAILLAIAAGALWLQRGGGASDNDLVALAQAARSDARSAMVGNAAAFDRLTQIRARLERAAGETGAGWQAVVANLDRLIATRAALLDVRAAADRIEKLAPQLLAATGNVASGLSAADLTTDKPYLERFEITVEGVQQNVRALARGAAIDETVGRLGDASQYLDQIIRGLRGEDASLGLVPVRGPGAQGNLDAAARLFADMRTEIGTVVGAATQLKTATAAVAGLDAAAAGLLDSAGPGAGSSLGGLLPRLPLLLVAAALAIMLLMMFAYYRARDFRRAAEIQAEQNERNQQAILRLLDELSSLADGDLTVQATVTEDITGAIADSINYAIEALRELVATINDSSILVDAAAKQTEGSARHLVRSAETQAKQAAAASESMARMAASIEEVSGNAERCSDVARHSVEVAHKGGDAVRRTIAGMNTIRETIQDTSKRIKRLGESSQEIGNIVELIEEIAEQTNILALNASIEASRAGEASRGFAVVADEVQKLAERSTNATKKIEVLVSTIQSDTNEAVVSMERSTTDVVGGALLAENAGAALDEIEQVSHQIASLVQNISGSSKEQASVAGAITKNMHVLREISSKTTESMSATSSAISKLSALASQLRKTIAGFTLPDHGGGTGVLNAARVSAGFDEADPTAAPVAEIVERRRHSG